MRVSVRRSGGKRYNHNYIVGSEDPKKVVKYSVGKMHVV